MVATGSKHEKLNTIAKLPTADLPDLQGKTAMNAPSRIGRYTIAAAIHYLFVSGLFCLPDLMQFPVSYS
jgi:hypothetical protein